MSASRLGVFGGTFDPLHHAHLIVAAEAYDALELDLLLFLPAADPPHKRGSVIATADQRLRMIRAAIHGDSRFDVDDLELRRGGPSYTVDSLRELCSRSPGVEFFLLIGADQYREFESWKDPERIAEMATLSVMGREGDGAGSERGRFRALDVEVSRVDLSASAIRARIAAGRSIRYFVPDAVRSIIEAERIYEGLDR